MRRGKARLGWGMKLDFSRVRALCIGDVMLDRFVYGQVSRVSPEAPVPIIRVSRETAMLGGAGNVARNIAALGGEATLIGIVGADKGADELRARISETDGICDALVACSRRPTTCKTRIIAANQQVARLDEEILMPLQEREREIVLQHVAAALPNCDIIVLSDYAKGMLTRKLVASIISLAGEAGVPVLVDPKQDDFSYYSGATLIKPNLSELGSATRMPIGSDEQIRAAAAQAMLIAGAGAILVTRSEKGMMYLDADGNDFSVSSRAREVFDVSGAGDTVIAALAVAMGAGMPIESVVHIANIAASLVVAKLGTATITAAELMDELDAAARAAASSEEICVTPMVQAAEIVEAWRMRGLRVGFTNGCFDILHRGHVRLLEAARSRCDRLVLALNTDDSVRRLKGPERPVNELDDRAAVLMALQAVDVIVAFAEDTPLETIKRLRPNMLFKGADYSPEQVVGADIVKADGGELVLLDLVPGRSTTNIIARARGDALAAE